MKDLISELQCKALDIIQREGLEEEYNKYCISKGPYSRQLRYMLIDFVIQYTELNIGRLEK